MNSVEKVHPLSILQAVAACLPEERSYPTDPKIWEEILRPLRKDFSVLDFGEDPEYVTLTWINAWCSYHRNNNPRIWEAEDGMIWIQFPRGWKEEARIAGLISMWGIEAVAESVAKSMPVRPRNPEVDREMEREFW